MADGEIRTFAVVVTFMLVFTALLGTAPSGLVTAPTGDPAIPPVNPLLLAQWAEVQQVHKDNFTIINGYGYYDYTLGGWNWRLSHTTGSGFRLGIKVLLFGWLWIGTLDFAEFIYAGLGRGESLSFTEIAEDETNGTVHYEALHSAGGGTFVVSYNDTAYASASLAWDDDALYLVHGLGIDDTAPANAITLVFGLLTLTVPDMPYILQILIAVPLWAGAVYIIFLAIVKLIPFLGG
jgi:hypothetical protein